MAWTQEETLKYQMDNKQHLDEINKTLSGCSGNEKVGIFCQGQLGDTATVMSVLEYKEIVFYGKDIIWYINTPNCDLLKYAPIAEVRPWPWAGNGLPLGTPDFYPLLCNEYNRLDLELAKQYELTSDLSDGYFPATWMVDIDNRRNVSYPNVSKKQFGIPDDWAWHPVLYFSDEERAMAVDFMDDMEPAKTIAIESFAGSNQSKITGEQIVDAMIICRRELGKCNFVFTSHKFINGNEEFPEGLINNVDTFSAAHFTVRQCALVVGQCDLLISVSSGISVAASCWGNNPTKIIQYCGSYICSTQPLALGEFILVTTDGKELKTAWKEFELELIKLLNKIK